MFLAVMAHLRSAHPSSGMTFSGTRRCYEAAQRLWQSLAPLAPPPGGPVRRRPAPPALSLSRAAAASTAAGLARGPKRGRVTAAAAQQQQQQQQQLHAQQQQQQQQPADPPPPMSLPLRQKYASTRVLARAPALIPPGPTAALPPAARAWFDRLRIPPAVLERAGVGPATVIHPQSGAPVDAIALPYLDAGRLVDVRYWTLDAQGQLGDSWLAHGGWPLYALDPATTLAAAGDVVVTGCELDVLALAAAGVPAALAVPQQLPGWRAGTPAYDDAPARAQPLRDHIAALQQAREAEAAADGPGGGDGGAIAGLAASLGLSARAAGPSAAAPTRRSRRNSATTAAPSAAQGLSLLLPNADTAVLALGDSQAEQALANELAGLLGAARCRGVAWPRNWDEHNEEIEVQPAPGDDGARSSAADVLMHDGPEVLLLYLTRAHTWPVEGIERFGDCGDQLLAAFEGRMEQQRAHSTGWPVVDQIFQVTPGELTLVTGVPNSGKSEWLDALAVNLALTHSWRFALCSLEKRPRDHARQLVEKIAGRPMLRAAYAGDTPRMSVEELEAAFDVLDRHFVVIHTADDAMPTLDWVLEKARAAVVKYGVRGFILDPYNELDHSRAPGKNEHEYISEFMARLRNFAKTNLCHVFLVAHPKQRANWRGEAPTLMDVSGGANFFAKCDNGIIVHRDWSQVNQTTDGRRTRGRPKQGAGDGEGEGDTAAAAAQQQQQQQGQEQQQGADGQQQQGGFLGYSVDIIVQKVRNKNTGSKGRAMLEYDPASGRYYEPQAGQPGAQQGGSPASGVVVGGAPDGGSGGDGSGGLVRDVDGLDLEVTDLPPEEDEETVDDALVAARRDQEVLLGVKQRGGGGVEHIFDLTNARSRELPPDDPDDPRWG